MKNTSDKANVSTSSITAGFLIHPSGVWQSVSASQQEKNREQAPWSIDREFVLHLAWQML
jgi:hypothetical protein